MQCTKYGDRTIEGEFIENPQCHSGDNYYFPSEDDIQKFCKTGNFENCPRFRLGRLSLN